MMALGLDAFVSVRAVVKSVVPKGVVAVPTTSPPFALSASVMAWSAERPPTVSAVVMYQRFPWALTSGGGTASDILGAVGMNANVWGLHREPRRSMMWGHGALKNLFSCLATSPTA